MVSGKVFAVILTPYLLDRYIEMGKWHRSKETQIAAAGLIPYGSNMLNKKWTLEEEFNNHILRFQQVNITVILSSARSARTSPGSAYISWDWLIPPKHSPHPGTCVPGQVSLLLVVIVGWSLGH